MTGRRSILSAIGAMFTAPAVDSFVAKAGTTAPFADLGAAVSAMPEPSLSSDLWPDIIPEGPLRKMFERARRRVEFEQEIIDSTRRARHYGYDPDIACMKSWSPVFKEHVQAQRVREEAEISTEIHRRLWG